ncbi:CMP/dCMP deaminase, zinc-binding [Kalmanozyma brasiliensis GHG001]|uniref:CMP/dCMP-type deaminase domain-containing protein n=1 Tax=Kalmanozyma brasiliensis (strain GHG001) TaxID=1365824 RepID=V5GFP7_KALBG|nr:CMP/dCMP deaminase, zinc-binding [Kalmanozyma brasiliensis GHG001]EST04852.1 CMP/dCMP deaminase, zinc-binding [Kalmanozyma brasiliensis GHG001]
MSTSDAQHHGHAPSHLLAALLSTITTSIIPLTTPAVARGCKVFGASILSKSTLTPIVSSTNDEITSPLLHGEMATLFAFHEHNNSLPAADRVDPKDCVFLATHEPCSLCLSAITWSGFDNFYYLFTYRDTMESFAIPHDIEILKEVFQTSQGDDAKLYNRKNKYWQSWSFQDLIDQSPQEERGELQRRLEEVKAQYNGLSETYQSSKADQTPGQIPLA